MSDLRAEIRAELARRMMPSKALARALGISDQYVSDMLREKRGIGPRMLDRIIDVLWPDYGPNFRENLHKMGAREAGWDV